MREWQVFFELKGLVAPKDGTPFDDCLLFRRARRPKGREYEESDDLSQVYFKVSDDAQPSHQRFLELRSTLEKILYFYGLVSGRYVEFPNQASMSDISHESPFGKPFSVGVISSSVALNEEQLRLYSSLLRATMQMFRRFEFIFEEASKRYLRNAIVYYYRALRDLEHFALEEALIDLIISLEYLLSRDNTELSYRLSLRSSSILSIERREERRKIFDEVHDLYNKRSKIVHGIEKKVDLSYEELTSFGRHVKSIILTLLNFNMPKKQVICLLDQSLLSEETRKELGELLRSMNKNSLDLL